MAWDMGAPIWPYQASDILLRMLNGPAYSIAMPTASLLRLAAPMHLLLVIPGILASWWFLGYILDRGFARWSLFVMFVVLVALLLWAVTGTPGIFRVRLEHGFFRASITLLLVRFLTPVACVVALTSVLSVKAKPSLSRGC